MQLKRWFAIGLLAAGTMSSGARAQTALTGLVSSGDEAAEKGRTFRSCQELQIRNCAKIISLPASP